MSFGLEKCAVLEIRRGRQVDSSGIGLPDDQHIGEIGEEGYKYLGILQLDQNLNTRDESQNNIGIYQKSQEVM